MNVKYKILRRRGKIKVAVTGIPVNWLKMRWIKLEKSKSHLIQFKYDFHEDIEFSAINIRKSVARQIGRLGAQTLLMMITQFKQSNSTRNITVAIMGKNQKNILLLKKLIKIQEDQSVNGSDAVDTDKFDHDIESEEQVYKIEFSSREDEALRYIAPSKGTLWERLNKGRSVGRLTVYTIFKDDSGPTVYGKRHITRGSTTSAFNLIIDEGTIFTIHKNVLQWIRLHNAHSLLYIISFVLLLTANNSGKRTTKYLFTKSEYSTTTKHTNDWISRIKVASK
uniref:Uncharacterized protein n=1 Tax=Glossina pallidipes TaxID=7398 RepID=A0A1A9ZLE5_GLOPL